MFRSIVTLLSAIVLLFVGAYMIDVGIEGCERCDGPLFIAVLATGSTIATFMINWTITGYKEK